MTTKSRESSEEPDDSGNYPCGCVYSLGCQEWLYVCPDHLLNKGSAK